MSNNKITLLLGDFTFLDPKLDGEHKCIINCLDEVMACFDTIDEAESMGEGLLELHESYLVLNSYKGSVELNQDLPNTEYKKLHRLCEKFKLY